MTYLIVFSLLTLTSGEVISRTAPFGIEYFVDTNVFKNVIDARDACRSQGGVLATPRNQNEIYFIADNFDLDWMRIDGLSEADGRIYWLFGGHEVIFRYEDGTEFSLSAEMPWEQRKCKYRRCGILVRGRQFRAHDASETNHFVCQKAATVQKPIVRDEPVTQSLPQITTEVTQPPARDQFVTRDEMEVFHRRMEQVATQIEVMQSQAAAANNSQLIAMNDNSLRMATVIEELQNKLTALNNSHLIVMNNNLREREAAQTKMQELSMQIVELQRQLTALNCSRSVINGDSSNDLQELEIENGFTNLIRLQISGKPKRMGFRISLMENGTENIAFQLSVDFSKRIVSRTSFLNGDWGPIDRYGGFPFDLNDYFTIAIRSDESSFYVRVNGQDFCSFDHRFKQLEDIKLVRVEGNIVDLEVRI